MTATVTLSTLTLASSVTASATFIPVSSTAGITPGTRLWVDRELMAVTSLGVDPWLNVQRGVDGTSAVPHAAGSTTIFGSASQFYEYDPRGVPAESVPVSPWINTRNGTVWVVMGDDAPPNRWWQQQITTYGIGAFGVRTTTVAPPDPTAP